MNDFACMAFDLGASHGRGVVAEVSHDKLHVSEIHRFENRPVLVHDRWYWNVLGLWDEMQTALGKAAKRAEAPLVSVAVDTWGVDFGLLDSDGDFLGLPRSYRDPRTDGIAARVFHLLSERRLYALTGVAALPFNTLFQLWAIKESRAAVLDRAAQLLLMPDLFTYLLSGERRTEYTVATTSQLVAVSSRAWEREIFEALDLPVQIMADLVQPGTQVGELHRTVARDTGHRRLAVLATASHDTAAAVAAVPAQGGAWAFISVGTWSLVGVERSTPILSSTAQERGFTNEGGVAGRYRFLKNVTGLWLWQQCQYAWQRAGSRVGDRELLALAESAGPSRCVIDPDWPGFLHPTDMPSAIASYCRRTDQPVPVDKGTMARAILEGLAMKQAWVIADIQEQTGQAVEIAHMVGGGSRNRLLAQLTADAARVPLVAGPAEATVMGNILVQAMANRVVSDLEQGRAWVRAASDLTTYEPRPSELCNEAMERMRRLIDDPPQIADADAGATE